MIEQAAERATAERVGGRGRKLGLQGERGAAGRGAALGMGSTVQLEEGVCEGRICSDQVAISA